MVNKMREVRLAELHPAQQAIVDHPARFKVLACGRRFGKTTVAIDLICTHLLKGESAAYFAPTYRMTREVWEDVKRILAPVIKQVREHDYRLELLTGGILDCWSLMGSVAETVRGRTYHFAVMDEAALFDSASVWHGAIRPLLTDTEGGALFASTPMGRNWFWNLYLQGLRGGQDENWQSWRYPTLTNPYIKATEVEAAREGMPERYFRQEYLAEFLDDGGVVFRNIEQVCSGEAMAEVEGGMSTFFGVDWGEGQGLYGGVGDDAGLSADLPGAVQPDRVGDSARTFEGALRTIPACGYPGGSEQHGQREH